MIRRNARLRSEYLYRKNLEGKTREEYEKKRKIKQALRGPDSHPQLRSSSCILIMDFALPADGKKIPTELKYEYEELKNEIDLDDDNTKSRSLFFFALVDRCLNTVHAVCRSQDTCRR